MHNKRVDDVISAKAASKLAGPVEPIDDSDDEKRAIKRRKLNVKVGKKTKEKGTSKGKCEEAEKASFSPTLNSFFPSGTGIHGDPSTQKSIRSTPKIGKESPLSSTTRSFANDLRTFFATPQSAPSKLTRNERPPARSFSSPESPNRNKKRLASENESLSKEVEGKAKKARIEAKRDDGRRVSTNGSMFAPIALDVSEEDGNEKRNDFISSKLEKGDDGAQRRRSECVVIEVSYESSEETEDRQIMRFDLNRSIEIRERSDSESDFVIVEKKWAKNSLKRKREPAESDEDIVLFDQEEHSEEETDDRDFAYKTSLKVIVDESGSLSGQEQGENEMMKEPEKASVNRSLSSPSSASCSRSVALSPRYSPSTLPPNTPSLRELLTMKKS